MPPKNYKTITVRIEIYEILKKLAEQKNMTIPDLLREILSSYKKHLEGSK